MNQAQRYIDYGWKVVPVPRRGKGPKVAGWQDGDFTAADCSENVGVILGRSKLVDIDLDVPEAVELAKEHLGKTLSFGRASRPSSHYLFTGEATYRKFNDPNPVQLEGEDAARECLLEIRSGKKGLQTVFPGSIHASGELIEWDDDPDEFDPELCTEEVIEAVGQLAIATWQARHPDEDVPPRVAAWAKPLEAQPERPSVTSDIPVLFDHVDDVLVDLIAKHYPDANKHDYRLAVAGSLHQKGCHPTAAFETLHSAAERAGKSDHAGMDDCRSVIVSTYEGKQTAGPGFLKDTPAVEILDRLNDLGDRIEWDFSDEQKTTLEDLYGEAKGESTTPLEEERYLDLLVGMYRTGNPQLETVWAKLKHYAHVRNLKKAVELRARSKKGIAEEQMMAKHPDNEGLKLPDGYFLDKHGRLCGVDGPIAGGCLEVLSEIPPTEGDPARLRVAFKNCGDSKWQTCVLDKKAALQSGPSGVITLNDQNFTVNSRNAQALVDYIDAFLLENAGLLRRPVLCATGWARGGGFVWGEKLLRSDESVAIEYPLKGPASLALYPSLRASGDREVSYAAIRSMVEEFPGMATVLAASLAAPFVSVGRRSMPLVSVFGTGGTGKTRMLKIAGSVWGFTGDGRAYGGNGLLVSTSSTDSGLRDLAGGSRDLPFFVTDVSKDKIERGFLQSLHALVNQESRHRDASYGSQREARCGAIITDSEFTMKEGATTQGHKRRMLEIQSDIAYLPKDERAEPLERLYRAGETVSDNFGFLGPEYVERFDAPDSKEYDAFSSRARRDGLGPDQAEVFATLALHAARAAEVLDTDPKEWVAKILRVLRTRHRVEVEEEGYDKSESLHDFLEGLIEENARRIAISLEQWNDDSEEPRGGWFGGYSSETGRLCIRKRELDRELKEAGYDGFRREMEQQKLVEGTGSSRKLVDGKAWRLRGYWINLERFDLNMNSLLMVSAVEQNPN